MSAIEWTDETWNPTVGCTRVSPGCQFCYAERSANRMQNLPAYEGLTQITNGRPQWTGTVRCLPERLTIPLKWKKPRRIFVDSMSDLFHPDVPFAFQDKIWSIMRSTPQHTYQILTKRPERMAAYLLCERRPWRDEGPLPNVWLGTSVEDQERADDRIPHLLQCPAAVRFLSVEPLIGPVDLSGVAEMGDHKRCEECGDIFLSGDVWSAGLQITRRTLCAFCDGALQPRGSQIHWVIVGGESGPGARPCDLAWIRDIIQQCRAERVPVFVKQLGSNPMEVMSFVDSSLPKTRPGIATLMRLRPPRIAHPKGGDPKEWSEDLRVREMPR